MVPLPSVSEGRSPLPIPMQLCDAGEFTRMRDASTRSPNSRTSAIVAGVDDGSVATPMTREDLLAECDGRGPVIGPKQRQERGELLLPPGSIGGGAAAARQRANDPSRESPARTSISLAGLPKVRVATILSSGSKTLSVKTSVSVGIEHGRAGRLQRAGRTVIDGGIDDQMVLRPTDDAVVERFAAHDHLRRGPDVSVGANPGWGVAGSDPDSRCP